MNIKNNHEPSAVDFGELSVGDTFLDGDDLYIKIHLPNYNAMHLNKEDYGFTNFPAAKEIEKVTLDITIN